MARARIIGTGSAVPEMIRTNFDLEKMVDTTDDWITTRTGIRERRIAAEGEYTSTFATRAAERALEMAGVTAEEIDLLIVATVTPDFPFPSTACIVQSNIGAKRAAAFDVSAACSGFLYGLSLADNAIRSGGASKALIIGAEVLSRVIDWTDRNTCLLFGDGSGAVVVEACESEQGVLSTHLHSDGSYWELLYQPGCGNRNPAVQKTLDERKNFLRMQGNEVFKLAVRAMEDAALQALEKNGLTPSDISIFIPHQANRRIIDAIGKRLGLSDDKVYVNLDRYGNTSSASIPLALDEANRGGRINEGDIVLFDAFGGGLTWASVLLRW
ncbi:3-oxoacyl-(acyl-carrier-protein) synthase III [Geobacter metallireducens RCH3]|uniref:Beta-ketoacyl-[acyl-carrier-protein] synthase III n=1 Tax=Geobacter metallireducens (strain ATCC 53774 / DSM 7210 / GS-15) TaxID=269799 RepID=Q39V93_GEOMG|nr:beta-ketoacyl-ACP synthase III [Geobacter metallireducens]ABB31831.1 3-oxoacyl-(acyl carrier protein) synthase III [Geobacter metallireducens GS-15]EHP89287.1 3-oxoacyl-(acyl-carrier-protein) synthase III [Geobacter metallireducens RCH3]